jgi:hypothetical protein
VALQDQVYLRAHAVDFFISLLTTVDGWAERTLAEIQGWKDLSPDGKNEASRSWPSSRRAHRSHTGAAPHPAATATLWAKNHRVKVANATLRSLAALRACLLPHSPNPCGRSSIRRHGPRGH